MMRKIDSIEDDMRGRVTYDLGNGKWITLDARTVREHGLKEVLKYAGVDLPTGRLPVFQGGLEIGSVPVLFEPLAIQSKSFLYDARPGDFKRIDRGWEASKYLGPGDLEAVPGFEWNDADRRRQQSANEEDERQMLMSILIGKP